MRLTQVESIDHPKNQVEFIMNTKTRKIEALMI